jgi:effector-binding domain-containing protein
MGEIVSIQRAEPRTIAAVRARMTPGRVPLDFRHYLDQVYAAGGIARDGQNIFVYRDALDQSGQLDIEFGVGVTAPFAAVGNVRAVELPVGDVAMTTHVGSYAGLGGAHEAVQSWCREHALTLAGPRWEIYGHWVDGEPPRTDICYLVQPAETT